jgi:hypothetical protein
MFLALAWAITPKQSRAPYFTWCGPRDAANDEVTEFWKRYKKTTKLSDNDWKETRTQILSLFEQDKKGWLKSLGASKDEWAAFGLDQDAGGARRENAVGLTKWM